MAYYTSTTEPLEDTGEDGDEYISPTRLTERHDAVAGAVFSDKVGTLYIEQSSDGENWDISTSNSVAAGVGEGFSENLYLAFWRIRYVNTGTGQSEFRLSARTIGAGDS